MTDDERLVARAARLAMPVAIEQADDGRSAIVVLIVGQRVSTISRADQILVLEDGHTMGLGTHRELLETCPTYAEIVASQLTEEDAA